MSKEREQQKGAIEWRFEVGLLVVEKGGSGGGRCEWIVAMNYVTTEILPRWRGRWSGSSLTRRSIIIINWTSLRSGQKSIGKFISTEQILFTPFVAA